MKSVKLLILTLLTLSLRAQQPITYKHIVDSLITWVNTHPKIDSQYIETLHRVSYLLSETDVKKSFEYYVKVASLSDSLHFVFGKALAQINLGLLLMSAMNYEASNGAFLKAIDEADSCHSLLLKAVSYNSMCDNFASLGCYSKSVEYLSLALMANKRINATRGIAINLELLASCDFNAGKFSNAYADLLEGISFAVKTNDNYVLLRYYIGLGKIAAIKNKTDSATYFFSRVTKQAKIDGDLNNEYSAYLAQAQYLKNIPLDKKILFLDSALNIARKSYRLDRIAEASEHLSSIYDTLKNKDSSQYYYHQYIINTDSLINKRNRLNVILEQSDWLINRNNMEIRNFEDHVKLQQEEIDKKDDLLFASIMATLLSFVIAFFIYNSIQSKKKHHEAVLQQKIAEAEAISLRAKIEQLIKLQQIRRQISSDLHDDVGSSLSNIMVMSELAKKRKEDIDKYFEKIQENAGNIMEHMNDIVWSVNPENDTMEQMFARMQSFASCFLEKKDLKFQFTTADDLLPVQLTMEERKNFYLVFKEAIHNAFKYSGGTDVTTNIVLQDDHIVMRISDNGNGFSTVAKYTGNGLTNMARRAKEINGKLEIISSVNNGTSIILIFKPTQMGS